MQEIATIMYVEHAIKVRTSSMKLELNQKRTGTH